MINKIIIATKNKGKVSEFEALFSSQGILVQSLLDFTNQPDVEETGKTFRENAVLKAETISKRFNQIVIADDSGLVVDALDGNPGVYSARYAGIDKDDQANIEKVLKELDGISKERRSARFVCSLAVAIPGRETEVFEADCEGYITEKIHGEHGFGYDPIFYVPSKEKTMAEMTREEKNELSHRAKALKLLLSKWKLLLS